jgi:hypothetical protein
MLGGFSAMSSEPRRQTSQPLVIVVRDGQGIRSPG